MVKSEIYLQTVAHTSFSNLEEVVPSPHRDNAGIKKRVLGELFFQELAALARKRFQIQKYLKTFDSKR